MLLQLFPVMVLYLCTEIGTEHLRDYIMKNVKFKLHSDYIKALNEFVKNAKKSTDRFYGMISGGRISLYGNYSVIGLNVESFENNSDSPVIRLKEEMIEKWMEAVKADKIKCDELEVCISIVTELDHMMCFEMCCSYNENYSSKHNVDKKFLSNMLEIRCKEPKDVKLADMSEVSVNFALVSDAMKVLKPFGIVNGIKFDSNKSEVAWLNILNDIVDEDEFNYGIVPMK